MKQWLHNLTFQSVYSNCLQENERKQNVHVVVKSPITSTWVQHGAPLSWPHSPHWQKYRQTVSVHNINTARKVLRSNQLKICECWISMKNHTHIILFKKKAFLLNNTHLSIGTRTQQFPFRVFIHFLQCEADNFSGNCLQLIPNVGSDIARSCAKR